MPFALNAAMFIVIIAVFEMPLSIRECWTALKPFVEPAVYVNALEDGDEEGERRVREAYGPNYSRLTALKAKYDPENIFRQNSNIKPAGK
jgi:hypothetical protein